MKPYENLSTHGYKLGAAKPLFFSLLLGSILDIIRGEAKLLEGLHNLGIMGSTLSKFLQIPVTTVDDIHALDIRHAAIMVRLKKCQVWVWKKVKLRIGQKSNIIPFEGTTVLKLTVTSVK